jgi:hypothetical protein
MARTKKQQAAIDAREAAEREAAGSSSTLTLDPGSTTENPGSSLDGLPGETDDAIGDVGNPDGWGADAFDPGDPENDVDQLDGADGYDPDDEPTPRNAEEYYAALEAAEIADGGDTEPGRPIGYVEDPDDDGDFPGDGSDEDAVPVEYVAELTRTQFVVDPERADELRAEAVPAIVADTAVQAMFDWSLLEPAKRESLEEATAEIRRRIRRSAEDVLEIGRLLRHVKDDLPRGMWGGWLRVSFDWSERTAQRFIQTSSVFDALSAVRTPTEMFEPTAMYLIAAGTTPEQVRWDMVDRANAGEYVTAAVVRAAVDEYRLSPSADAVACDECGEVVASGYWHCPGCDHHWPANTDACPNCGAFAPPAAATVIDLIAVPDRPDVFSATGAASGDGSDEDDADDEAPAPKPEYTREQKAARMLSSAVWITGLEPAAVAAELDDIQRENMGDLLVWFAEFGRAIG